MRKVGSGGWRTTVQSRFMRGKDHAWRRLRTRCANALWVLRMAPAKPARRRGPENQPA